MKKIAAVLFLLYSSSFAAARTRYVALTFDDGPHIYYTDKILSILKRWNVHATFFLVGKMVAKNPQLVRHIVNSGSEVGNHTYNHPRLIHLNNQQVEQEIKSNNDLLESITGTGVKYFRPPGGRYYFSTLEVLKNMEIILWTINTDDIYSPASKIYSDTIRAKGGDIILMHSGVPQTIEVLPKVLEYFSKHNIKPVLLDELQKKRSEEIFDRPCPQGL